MINELAILFQREFGINFTLIGAKSILDFPYCSMQVINQDHSKFKKTINNIKYKTVKTTIQFNYNTKKALEDLEFISKFINYLNYKFKFDCKEIKKIENIEVTNYSSVRDLTSIENGTGIFAKSIDVTFNLMEESEIEIIDLIFVDGQVNNDEISIKK